MMTLNSYVHHILDLLSGIAPIGFDRGDRVRGRGKEEELGTIKLSDDKLEKSEMHAAFRDCPRTRYTGKSGMLSRYKPIGLIQAAKTREPREIRRDFLASTLLRSRRSRSIHSDHHD